MKKCREEARVLKMESLEGQIMNFILSLERFLVIRKDIYASQLCLK